jgi:hypothetical protein
MVGSGKRVFFVALNSLCILCAGYGESAVPRGPGILCAIPYADIVSSAQRISMGQQEMPRFSAFSEKCKKSVCLHAHEPDADNANADHRLDLLAWQGA